MKFSIKKYFKKTTVQTTTITNGSRKKKNRDSTATTSTSKTISSSINSIDNLNSNVLSTSTSKGSIHQEELQESSLLDSKSLLQIQLPDDFSRPFEVPELHGDYINERISVMSATTTTRTSSPMTTTSSQISSSSFFDANEDLAVNNDNNNNNENNNEVQAESCSSLTVDGLKVGRNADEEISPIATTDVVCEEQFESNAMPVLDTVLIQLETNDTSLAKEEVRSPIISTTSSSNNVIDIATESTVINDEDSLSLLLQEPSTIWSNDDTISFMTEENEITHSNLEETQQNNTVVESMERLNIEETEDRGDKATLHYEKHNVETMPFEIVQTNAGDNEPQSITVQKTASNSALSLERKNDIVPPRREKSVDNDQANAFRFSVRNNIQKKPDQSFIPRKHPSSDSKEIPTPFNAFKSEIIKERHHRSFIPVKVTSPNTNSRRLSTDVDNTGSSSLSTATTTTSSSSESTALSFSSSTSSSSSASSSLKSSSNTRMDNIKTLPVSKKRPISNVSLIPKYNYHSSHKHQQPQQITVPMNSCSSSNSSRIPKRRVSVGPI